MKPLVSCIMPTWNRRPFIRAAIDCWMRQIYENRELIILDDGEDCVVDLVPSDPRIRYLAISPKVNTGGKRNQCCRLARGEIICQCDDDDWSAPDRITHQVEILERTGKPITGYSSLLFWDIAAQQAKIYRSACKNYVCGTSLCYRKDFWQQNHFKPIQQASDNGFVYPNMPWIAPSDETSHMVARIHEHHHTSSKAGITEVVGRELIPAGFWENEEFRQHASDPR